MSAVTYLGGLPSAQRNQSDAVRRLEREDARLRVEIGELWQHVADLRSSGSAPPPPPDHERNLEALTRDLRELAKRFDVLEKGLPGRLDRARNDALVQATTATGEALAETLLPEFKQHRERLSALEGASATQSRTIDEAVRVVAQQHAEAVSLARFQIDSACALLADEARRFVAEH